MRPERPTPLRLGRLTRSLVERLVVALLLVAGLAGPAAAEEYQLQEGDVLELVVVGVAQMRQEARIDLDGMVRLPLSDPIPAAGRTVGAVEATLAEQMAGRAVQVVGENGRVTAMQIPPSAISLSVAAYRPVYVTGDVRTPGAFPFEPRLTVRRAVALAGGLGYGRYSGGDPEFLAAGIQGELALVQSRIAAQERRLARQRALLTLPVTGGAAAAETERETESTAIQPGEDLDDVDALRLRLAEENLRADILQTQEELTSAQRRLDVLEQQLAVEDDGAAADVADYERLQDLAKRGSITADRVSDARRATLDSATRQLQVRAEVARAEREVRVLRRRLTDLRREADAAALAELTEAQDALSELRAARRGLEARLAYLGSVGAGFESLYDVSVVVQRTDGRVERVGPDADAALAPGDLVEVEMTLLDGATTAAGTAAGNGTR